MSILAQRHEPASLGKLFQVGTAPEGAGLGVKGLMQLLVFVNTAKRPLTELIGKLGADCQRLPPLIPAPTTLCVSP